MDVEPLGCSLSHSVSTGDKSVPTPQAEGHRTSEQSSGLCPSGRVTTKILAVDKGPQSTERALKLLIETAFGCGSLRVHPDCQGSKELWRRWDLPPRLPGTVGIDGVVMTLQGERRQSPRGVKYVEPQRPALQAPGLQ